MCPGQGVTAGVQGVQGRERLEYNVDQSEARLQVFIFYPMDWEEDSVSLLTSFSTLHPQFLATQCCLYGCSTDSVSTHARWLQAELGSSLPFPLLSDMAGNLADKYSLYDKEERVSMRGVVITDCKGKELEVITSSLDSEDLAMLTLNIVKEACAADTATTTMHGKLSGETNRGNKKVLGNKDMEDKVKESLPGSEHHQAPSANPKAGCRFLDHVWAKVVDNSSEVVESKRPRPSRVWGQSQAQGQAREGATTTEREEVRKPVKVWTPPSAKTTETDSQDNKPRPRPTKTWGAPPAPSCPVCGRAVYPVDQVFAADRSKFHKSCIECGVKGCQNKLTARGLHRVGGIILCTRCYQDRDKEKKVELPAQKVETAEETKLREAREMKEKKMNQEAMMELKAVIDSGTKPSESRSTC